MTERYGPPSPEPPTFLDRVQDAKRAFEELKRAGVRPTSIIVRGAGGEVARIDNNRSGANIRTRITLRRP